MTNIYKTQLEKEGMTNGNAIRISKALDELHTAVSRMDRQQLLLFGKVKLTSHLKRFAILEELMMFDLEKLEERNE